MGQRFWWLDPSKAERELGFQARDPYETLYDTVAYIRKISEPGGLRSSALLFLALPLQVLAMRSLVGLDVLETTLGVANGVELLSRLAPMRGSLGGHRSLLSIWRKLNRGSSGWHARSARRRFEVVHHERRRSIERRDDPLLVLVERLDFASDPDRAPGRSEDR
jgi:hypothetical protein